MDIKQFSEKANAYIKKYKFIALIVLIGIALMLFPTGKKQSVSTVSPKENGDCAKEQADELTDILKKISGVGDVYVLLTVSAAEKTVYQTNYDESTGSDSGSVRHDTVIIVDSERNEQGLIQQIIAPQYRGAVIVCNGADDPQVKLSVMEAVKNATGLGYDRISVLKM